MCSGPEDQGALDTLIVDLMNERGLSEEAEDLLRALWDGKGLPVTSKALFGVLFSLGDDDEPALASAYRDLHATLDELAQVLVGTGVGIVKERRQGWRLVLTAGAYTDV